MENIELITQIGSASFVIVEVAKKIGLPTRFAPALAVATGAILGALAMPEIIQGGILGLLSAATAMGLYSGVKATVEE